MASTSSHTSTTARVVGLFPALRSLPGHHALLLMMLLAGVVLLPIALRSRRAAVTGYRHQTSPDLSRARRPEGPAGLIIVSARPACVPVAPLAGPQRTKARIEQDEEESEAQVCGTAGPAMPIDSPSSSTPTPSQHPPSPPRTSPRLRC